MQGELMMKATSQTHIRTDSPDLLHFNYRYATNGDSSTKGICVILLRYMDEYDTSFPFVPDQRRKEAMRTITTHAQVSSFPVLHGEQVRRRQGLKVCCALSPLETRESRRLVSISLLILSIPKYATASGGFDRYMKRKKLDPLETYVPAIILTQVQIRELGQTLEDEKPEYGACRNVLRSGPAGSLRVNIRAVAQYASESGNDNSASNNVDQCLRALEELDSLFLNATRSEPQMSVKSLMKTKIGIAVAALDRLLETVPSQVLDKGKAIADSYLTTGSEDSAPPNSDPELQQLESIL